MAHSLTGPRKKLAKKLISAMRYTLEVYQKMDRAEYLNRQEFSFYLEKFREVAERIELEQRRTDWSES